MVEQAAIEAKVSDTNSSLKKATHVQAVVESKVQEVELSLADLERLELLKEQEDEDNAEVPEPSPKKQKIQAADMVTHLEPVVAAA